MKKERKKKKRKKRTQKVKSLGTNNIYSNRMTSSSPQLHSKKKKKTKIHPSVIIPSPKIFPITRKSWIDSKIKISLHKIHWRVKNIRNMCLHQLNKQFDVTIILKKQISRNFILCRPSHINFWSICDIKIVGRDRKLIYFHQKSNMWTYIKYI